MKSEWMKHLTLRRVAIVLIIIAALGAMFGFDTVQGWIEAGYEDVTSGSEQ